jgi:hypothetical protein
MNERWFKRVGWIYVPIHPLGYTITLLAFLFMVPIVISVDQNVHSITDELYQIFIYATCTAFWWKWVADKTSR